MNKALYFKHAAAFALVVLFAAIALASTASAATSGGLPSAFGKLCGHVSGATWLFKGRSTT
jgi:Spy/CpxP family protein refolding chaperone